MIAQVPPIGDGTAPHPIPNDASDANVHAVGSYSAQMTRIPEIEQAIATALREQISVSTSFFAALVAPTLVLELAENLAIPALLWAGRDGVVSIGLGAHATLRATGEERFSTIRKQAEEWFSRHRVLSSAVHFQTSRPRFWGAFAFEAGGAAQEPWQDFGDAWFVWPKIRVDFFGGSATVTVTIDPSINCAESVEFALLEQMLKTSDALPQWQPDFFSSDVSEISECSGSSDIYQLTSEDWSRQICSALQSISENHLAKVVVARKAVARLGAASKWRQLVPRLLSEPESTRFLLRAEKQVFLGATPERLISLRGDRAETEAVAGTIQVSDDTAAADKFELIQRSKDLHEHAFVVDAIRTALLPLAEKFDVPTTPLFRRHGHIGHLVTPISAQMRTKTHVLRLVEGLHPTPAVSGVPVAIANRWISLHESPRGLYAGPVGWFDESGDGEFAVGIRSAVIDGSEATLFSGAGIVIGSKPDTEYAETAWKQRPMLRVLGVSSDGSTT